MKEWVKYKFQISKLISKIQFNILRVKVIQKTFKGPLALYRCMESDYITLEKAEKS